MRVESESRESPRYTVARENAETAFKYGVGVWGVLMFAAERLDVLSGGVAAVLWVGLSVLTWALGFASSWRRPGYRGY